MGAKVRLGLKFLSVPQKIQMGRAIISGMTGNPSFVSPVPSLQTVEDAVNELEAALITRGVNGGGKLLTLVLYDKEAVFDKLLTQLALYVESAADGDEAIISSAHMELKRSPGPSPIPRQPGNLAALALPNMRIKLRWKKAEGAKAYLIEYAVENDSGPGWITAGVCTKCSFLIADLEETTMYLFRVRSAGAKGASPWSNTVSRRAIA